MKSRSVGYALGASFAVVAFFPKVTGALHTIPSPVMGPACYSLLALFRLFVSGLRTLAKGGLDRQKAIVAGVALVAGLFMQFQDIFAGLLPDPWDTLLGSSLTVGTVTAIALTVLLELVARRRECLEVTLDITQFPQIDAFLQAVASRMGWNRNASQRLRSAGEEALACLLQLGKEYPADMAPHLMLTVRPARKIMEIEFVAVFESANLEDRLAMLGELTETISESNVSLRLLRHYASSVRHQQYHGLDIITVRVTS